MSRGLSTTVVDAFRFAKPLDTDLIRRLAKEHETLLTMEEGAERRISTRWYWLLLLRLALWTMASASAPSACRICFSSTTSQRRSTREPD